MPTEEDNDFSSIEGTKPELVVAAGLLEATGDLTEDLSVADTTEQLRQLLSPAALWWSGPLTPGQDTEPLLSPGQVPRWRVPEGSVIARRAKTLVAAYRAALPDSPPASWGTPALRLQVPDALTAQRLASFGAVGQYLIVPSVEQRPAREFSWRWPMRIGIAPGVRGETWRRTLENSPYASLYDVRTIVPGDPEPFDIAFVDAGTQVFGHAAACIVMLGDQTSPLQNLALGRHLFHAPIVVGGASADVAWFERAVAEMAHDQPIDVAIRIASPTSLITADTNHLQVTAARRWALAKASQLRTKPEGDETLRDSDPASLLFRAGLDVPFDSERRGANGVTNVVRSLEQQGYDTALHIDPVKADAPKAAPPAIEVAAPIGLPPTNGGPQDTPATEPPSMSRPQELEALPQEPRPSVGGSPGARRLIADAQEGRRTRRKTLSPDSDHELLVRIAVPGKLDTAAPVDFPEGDLPTDTTVQLMVDVSSADLGLRARQPIVLSTADRQAPSTTALFKFRTRSEGSVVDIKILVTYKERPLQEAHYVATVRRQSVTGDRARLNPVPLSSWHEPLPGARPADASLEVNGANLVRTSTGRAVDLSYARNQGILDTIETLASRVLADDTAPESLAGDDARKLLVELARAGATFRQFLKPLDIGTATTISLLVDASTPIFPLELVYECEAPAMGAQLCQHRSGGTMVGKAEICANAGRRVVCPYAFWGQKRTVARTIRLDGTPRDRAAPAPLALSPVLFAATKRADAKTRTSPKPSDDLESQLGSLVGASQVVRATSWTDWRRKVEQVRPQLLVLLGHTESRGKETLLEIGARSWLSDPDVKTSHLRIEGSPLPVVVLLACSSAVPRDYFGGLTAAFAGGGAAAVVATLTKLHGPQGARAAAAVVGALLNKDRSRPANLGDAMSAARRHLLDKGLLVGLLLVAHGEIDLPLAA
jgi:hypothetical protein